MHGELELLLGSKRRRISLRLVCTTVAIIHMRGSMSYGMRHWSPNTTLVWWMPLTLKSIPNAFTNGVWMHLATSWNVSGPCSNYVNGVLSVSDPFYTYGLFSQNDYFKAFVDDFSSGWTAFGNIDEIGIWNRALTAEEIEQLYEGP